MPSGKKSQNHPHKYHNDHAQKQPAGSPLPALLAPSLRHSPWNRHAVATVEDIKSRAFRTEGLTQRALRFNYQLAIDLREKIQAEFDSLERISADPNSSVGNLKIALVDLSSKLVSEIEKQVEVQKKVAEAYETMLSETSEMAKQVLNELNTARLPVNDTAVATRFLSDVMGIIRETVDFWAQRPDVSRRKLIDLRRDTPRESMTVTEMLDLMEAQIKICCKALEHPLAGVISISKEFTKLNISLRS